MSKATISMDARREWAQYLYVESKLTQKEIAERVGVSQKTIGEWKEKYLWENLRKSLLITRQQQLSMLYNQLDSITQHVKDNQENIPTSKDADSILKITAAIRNLETDLSVADVFETCKRLITFVQKLDYEKSKEMVEYCDLFIKDCLKG